MTTMSTQHDIDVLYMYMYNKFRYGAPQNTFSISKWYEIGSAIKIIIVLEQKSNFFSSECNRKVSTCTIFCVHEDS